MPVIFEKRSKEHRHWWERFLFRCCELFHHSALEKGAFSSSHANAAFLAYRSWARYQGHDLSAQAATPGVGPAQRRSIWKSYYDLASQTLREDRKYPSLNGESEGASREELRRAQAAELRRVEAVYESVLLSDVSFPDANTINFEVDRWTDQVVANWRVITGVDWSDNDLGEGGKEAYGRRVLNVISFLPRYDNFLED